MAENRLDSVKRYFPDSAEFVRLSCAVISIMNTMTHDELKLHSDKMFETPKAKAARLIEEQRVLDAM